MKLLIVTALFPPEPVVSSKLSEDIFQEAKKRNYDVQVLRPKPTRPFGYVFQNYRNNKEEVLLNNYTAPKSSFLKRMYESIDFGRKAILYLKKNPNFDIVYFNTWPIFSQFLIAKYCYKKGIKTVMHIHDIYPESLNQKNIPLKNLISWLLLKIDKLSFKYSNQIICISESLVLYLTETRKIKPNKISFIYNWQNEKNFLHHYDKNKDDLCFMYLGNIGPLSDLHYIVKVFANLNLPKLKLIIAGSGSIKSNLEKFVNHQKFENIFFKEVPEGKVHETQSQADIMLLPQIRGTGDTSVPSKLPAYMFSKKPVLCSIDLGCEVHKIITKSNSGFVAQAGDKNSLEKEIIKIYNTPREKLKEFGENGYDFAIHNFSKKINLNKVFKILEKLC